MYVTRKRIICKFLVFFHELMLKIEFNKSLAFIIVVANEINARVQITNNVMCTGQKHLFLDQLTLNMTKDCSLIYQFST